MLKPDFPKKEMEREKWKERKGRNEKKENIKIYNHGENLNIEFQLETPLMPA